MKQKSISLKNYFELVKPQYIFFKLTPHSSCRNNSSDKLAQLVNKLYIDFTKRVYIEEKKLFFRTDTKVSYYIYLEKHKAEFYFIVPTPYKRLFKEKISDTWRNIEIKEVQELPQFSKDCTKYGLRYKKEDALSLAVDKRDNDLLSSTLNIMEILESDTNDKIGIIYNFIPSSPTILNSFREYHREVMEKYKKHMPLDKDKKNIWYLVKVATNFLLNTIDGVLEATQKDLKQTIQNNITIVQNRELSRATYKKENSTLCRSQIVVISESDNKNNQEINGRAACEAFAIIDEDNSLTYDEMKKEFNILDAEYPVKKLETSVQECQNFLQMPGRELLKQFNEIDHLKVLENPVPEELKTGVCYLGPVVYKSVKDGVFLNNSTPLRCLPHVIMGGSRSGKSTLSINICKNIIDAGEGLIVPDFIRNCEFADTIAKLTPPERLIDIDLSKYECIQALAINELKINDTMTFDEVSKIARRKASNFVELINIMNNDDKQLAPKMRKYLGAAARIAFCFNSSSGKDVMRILQNHTIRHNFINKLSDELKEKFEDSIMSLQELDEWSKATKDNPITEVCGTKENKVEGIIDRIDLFRENNVIDTMFSKSPEDNIDFVEAMEQNKVIVIRMRDCDFEDQTSKDVLMTFFMQKIWLAAKLRATKGNEEISSIPPRVTLLIDEIFQVPTCQKILEKTFLQSAKFGLKYMFTLHNLEGLSKEALASLKGANTTYTLISGVDKKAFEALEEEFSIHGYCLDDMLNLEQYKALHLIKNKNGYDALVTKLPPELKNNNKVE